MADDSTESALIQSDDSKPDNADSQTDSENSDQTPTKLSLSISDLQGKRVITSVNGEDDGDRSDVWEFSGNKWTAWMGTTALSPDPFTVLVTISISITSQSKFWHFPATACHPSN